MCQGAVSTANVEASNSHVVNKRKLMVKFVTPAIRISITFQDLGLIPGLPDLEKCDF